MSSLRGLMINRLIVLIQIFVFPLYFYLLFWIGPMKSLTLDPFFFWGTNPFSDTTEMVLLRIVSPLIFALPLTLFSIIRATRIADAYTLMWRSLGRVRIDTRIFYFVNALFCLFFFILPFGSPIISVIGAFLAIKLLFVAFGYKGHIPAIFIVIPGLFLAALPTMVTIAFFGSYQSVLVPIMNQWNTLLPYIYGGLLCLADAMAIGNFVLLMKEGASQVSYIKPYSERGSFFLKLLLFSGIFTLYGVFGWNASHISLFVINIIAVILSSLEVLIRWRKGLSRDEGGGGLLLIPIFIAVNFISSYWHLALSIVIGIAGLLFFALFIFAYMSATDETLF